jgi:hypothetical protein
VEFWACTPNPAGPYVLRQWLAGWAGEDILAFHDSDDLSCQDRFGRLHAEMARWGCDMVGSHELRCDDFGREIRAVRFPLDVSAALGAGPGHAQLFPTAAVRRAAFHRTGGLSTDRVFANDTQFLLRAYFHMIIRNADAFLYVRRKRPGSLTTTSETGLDSPARQEIGRCWKKDFEAVRGGLLPLEESSLRASASTGRHAFRRLPPEETLTSGSSRPKPNPGR